MGSWCRRATATCTRSAQRASHEAHSRHRRPAERRQVHAVQQAYAHARRLGRRCARPDPRSPLRRGAHGGPGVPRGRYRRAGTGRAGRIRGNGEAGEGRDRGGGRGPGGHRRTRRSHRPGPRDRRGAAAHGPARFRRREQSRRHESGSRRGRVPRAGIGRSARDFSRARAGRARPGGRRARRFSRRGGAGRRIGQVGEERVVTFDQPGTTRDAIDVELAIGGRRYILVDTAGLRRRGKVFESVEKFSVVKTLQAIDRANVAVLVLDAQGQISDQDAHIAGFILERGRALVVAVNKWDDLDDYARDMTKRAIALRLKFLSFARFHYISAREGRGVAQLIESVDRAYRAAMAKLPTPKLTRALIAAVAKQAPPRAGLSRPKLRYAHQGGSNPPTVVVHGTALNAVPDSYRRYLEADFRKVFRLEGTPLRIEFRSGRNPYVGKRL